MLLSVDEARRRLLAAMPLVSAEFVPLVEAAGRILAENLISDFDLPPFTNSSMDGYAIQAADLEPLRAGRPVALTVVADIPAGSESPAQIKSGQAARIMTGAPLPAGADAIVPVERTDAGGQQALGTIIPDRIEIVSPVDPGAFIRRRGEDVAAGQMVIEAGSRLRPQDVGLAAMLGIGQVKVFRKPIVALLSTGDELLPVGAPRQPGKIYESNGLTLAALIQSMGARVFHLGIAGDQAQAVAERLDHAAAQKVDLLITSAGVSVGAYDYVREVVKQRGELDFWRVNMRPGKPFAVGRYSDIPFIGLPGNPVSAYVGFEAFVRPALCRMMGYTRWERKVRKGRLTESITSDGRESYLRAVVTETNGLSEARLTGHQGSGNQFSLVQANALAVIPAGVLKLSSGHEIDLWLFEE